VKTFLNPPFTADYTRTCRFETASVTQLRRLFDRVYAALKPGGLFIFDIAEPGRGKGPRQKYREGQDWAVLLEVDEDSTTNLLTRRITSFRRVGKSVNSR
jgi:hypothetical protein